MRSAIDPNRVEFHRHALALFPENHDNDPGIVFYVLAQKGQVEHLTCTCQGARGGQCDHLKRFLSFKKSLGEHTLDLTDKFIASPWYQSAYALKEFLNIPLANIRVLRENSQPPALSIRYKTDHPLLTYYPDGSKGTDQSDGDATLLMERCETPTDQSVLFHRGAVLSRLYAMTLSPNERQMAQSGIQTRKQSFENSLWFKLAYHCFFRFEEEICPFTLTIDETSGEVRLNLRDSTQRLIYQVGIPPEKVYKFLLIFTKWLQNKDAFKLSAELLKTVIHMRTIEGNAMQMRLFFKRTPKDNQTAYYERAPLAKFHYGPYVYIKEESAFFKIDPDDKLLDQFNGNYAKTVPNKKLPGYLDKYQEDLMKGPHLIDESILNLKIFKKPDRLAISMEALDKDWCWLSLQYGFGNSTVSLRQILENKKNQRRFLPTPEGWVDCRAFDIERLTGIPGISKNALLSGREDAIKLSRLDLFRIQASHKKTVVRSGTNLPDDALKKFHDIQPSMRYTPSKGLASRLRNYQIKGVEWLQFLFENRLGGLLCDDMGLGKTHQVMALLVWLKERQQLRHKALIVCPTTVISHWTTKLKAHALTLTAAVYHGSERCLEAALRNDIIVTSYGILRNDLEKFMHHKFDLTVFDEAQYIKNQSTAAYKAAQEINAEFKIGLTGTPIENSIWDIRALMNVVLPDYLGSDDEFKTRYGDLIGHASRREELARLIAPFTLRRLKQTVLTELPPKIEDIRTCELSDDQVGLYQEAISAKGKGLLKELNNREHIPYIHIFSLLTLLKQICNHPASLEANNRDYNQYASGKWELFKELLQECLDCGLKVVVFTQFIPMVDLMLQYLGDQGIEAVSLTGKSKNRGDIIDRFNTDSNCQVFIASLKAGGSGIDLLGASVVIHYDRWWNAAKEDQATDRVYRIGQKKVVHVFKLVTQGTLEDKIAAIIENKRNLLDRVVKEDAPDTLKVFSREQLIDLLSFSAS